MPPQEAKVPATQPGDVNGADNNPEGPEDRGNIPAEDSVPTEPVSKEEAATLIQSAFRRFMARRQLQEPKKRSGKDCTEEPKSPTSAYIAASVEVQVGESLSNLRLSEESVSAQHRSSQKSRPRVFRVKHGELQRVEDEDSEQDRSDHAARESPRLCLLAADAELRRCEEAVDAAGPGGVQRGVELAGAVDDDAPGRVRRRRLHEQERGLRLGGRGPRFKEKESCGSGGGGRNGLSCYKPGKNRLRGGRNLPHRLQARSHKVSKKVHQREEQEPQKNQTEADACNPPTEYRNIANNKGSMYIASSIPL